MLPSILILSAVAVVALVVTRRRAISEEVRARRGAARMLGLAAGVQGAHFLEEAATGLHRALPGLVGQPAMPFSAFVAFNVAWLAIWVASIGGVRSGRPAAFFAAWFLAVAGVVNGIAHPLLALAAGGYFPGLATSPIIGLVATFLVVRLLGATEPASAVPVGG